MDLEPGDAGQSAGGSRRRDSDETATGQTSGELIEPVSYAGSCDSTEARLIPSLRREVAFPRKASTIERPHCFVLLTEVAQSRGRPGRCFRFSNLMADARSLPHYRRHYGGDNPQSNGVNFLFADGHVQWHSATYVAETLICCVDFGFRDNEQVSSSGLFDGAEGERIKRQHCGPPQTTETRRR